MRTAHLKSPNKPLLKRFMIIIIIMIIIRHVILYDYLTKWKNTVTMIGAVGALCWTQLETT